MYDGRWMREDGRWKMYEGGWDINEENETVTFCHALKLQMDAFSAKSLLFRKKVRIFAAAMIE
jgi:hypothetical protein